MARVVSQCGFHFWLDVLDPQLPGLTLGVQIAAVIEMALLNCTHVIAMETSNSPGSAWIPYEYGRVKTNVLYSIQAGCWVQPGVQPLALAEYYLLGEVTRTENDIKVWLNQEFPHASQGCVKRHEWTDGPSNPLT